MLEKIETKNQIAARKRMLKIPKKVLSERMRNLALLKNKNMSASERRRHAIMMGEASVVARKSKMV